MWFITQTTTGNRFYFAGGKQNYTVGRMGADLVLQADMCVSRSHAIFHLTGEQIQLEDTGSKFGTFHNQGIEKNTTLAKGCKVKLQVNDLIRFGRLQNVWKVEELTFNTVTSCLDKDDVEQVTANVAALGGKVLGQWSSVCTHLTMKVLSVTVKLLNALVDQKCIVTPKYWQDLAAAITAKKSNLPKDELYCPDAGDGVMDVSCRPERRYLFKGKTFVFLSRKHVDTYGALVAAAGGSFKDINSGVQKAFLIKNNVLVIQYNPSTQSQSSQTISTIEDHLQTHSKRIIPEYEIGLAILNCSLEEYCNPNYKIPESMIQTVANDKLDNNLTVGMGEAGDSTPCINSDDFEIPETNENLVTSTPYERVEQSEAATCDKEDDKQTMPYIRISETPVDHKNKKRILSVDSSESNDDEDLFQFSKKSCKEKNKDKPSIDKSLNKQNEVGEKETTSTSNASDAVRNIEDGANSVLPRTRAVKRSAFSDFLEKTQNKKKTNICYTRKEAKKRPHIQILGEEDNEGEEDDLFCFGDTQKNKKKRNDNQNPNSGYNEKDKEDDLFGFKEKETQSIDVDDDESDLQETDRFIPTTKSKKSSSTYFSVPKPKMLPSKISAIEWISGSLGKIKIKSEVSSVPKVEGDQLKTEETDTDAKTNDELNMTEDHRKWVESLKNAIEIHEVSFDLTRVQKDKSHYKLKNPQTASDNVNGPTKNFKTFVKKYQPSQKNIPVVQFEIH